MTSTGVVEVPRGGLLGGVLPVRRATQAFMRRWIRRGVIASFGLGFSVPYFRMLNGVRVKGDGVLKHLPRRRVVFLSNHQSYFLEAIAFFDLVYIRHQFDLEDPILRFSAAEETMKRGLVTNLMGLAGGVTFKRSFRAEGQDVQRGVDVAGAERVEQAIRDGWLLHFPAGTTRKGAPFRKGVARLLHNTRAVAVPVRVDGFRDLLLHKQIPGKLFKRASLTLHPPLELDDFYSRPYDREVGAEILARLESLIGDPE